MILNVGKVTIITILLVKIPCLNLKFKGGIMSVFGIDPTITSINMMKTYQLLAGLQLLYTGLASFENQANSQL